MSNVVESRQAQVYGQAPVADGNVVAGFGPTVIVVPHPDDESLGCGGLLARLAQTGQPVHALFVSDGSQSHPHSQTYPAPALRDLREAEARAALASLGLAPDATTFLRLPDSRVPVPSQVADFVGALQRLAACAPLRSAQTVLVPWRRDPHPDHRATYQLTMAALETLPGRPRVIEYPVWLWERGSPADMPQPGEVRAWRLDISAVLDQKQRAIAAHRSQVTRLIDDDPTAFYLSPDLLRHFAGPYEVFFEPVAYAYA